MTISINAQVAQLAAQGHQEISVVTLPSQVNKKSRKPRARRATAPKAVAPTIYTEAPTRNVTRSASAQARQARADRRQAAIDRAMGL